MRTKKWFAAVVLAWFLLGSCASVDPRALSVQRLLNHPERETTDPPFRGRLQLGDHDGDTYAVWDESRRRRIIVRLAGADTPEKDQPYGWEAAVFVAKITKTRRNVTVVPMGDGKYGRVLAHIILDDGRVLAEELIRSGYAWWYERYYRLDSRLQSLEAEAREAKRGLWNQFEFTRKGTHPISPEKWRRIQHESGKWVVFERGNKQGKRPGLHMTTSKGILVHEDDFFLAEGRVKRLID